MDRLTPTHKMLTSLGEVQCRQFSHLGLVIQFCINIIPGLLEMREIRQGMGVWFSMVWGSSPLGFLGGYIIESLAQAYQVSNKSVKLSSPSDKTVSPNN
jgi:hypothetical protein